MRIRKRPVLFSSSTLSDPHLINRSPVVVQLSDAAFTAPKPSHHASSTPPLSLDRQQPSDQPRNGSDDPSGETDPRRQHTKQDPLDEVVGRGETREDSREKGNHTRKERTQVDVLPLLSPSSTQDGRWYEGEKAIPLKKRRGNLEENNNNANATHSKKMKAKMKTKMNNNCNLMRDEDSVEEEDEEKEETKVNVSKKRGRGSALMEGSRCSRVNGRGWRCCQQTLVGYSLCEHHLGKGRLRSMTSVRSRSIAASTAPKKVQHVLYNNTSSCSSIEKQNECVNIVAEPLEEENEKKPEIMATKKRMKLGMVKARSISSLLGQTNTQVAAVVHENNSK